MDTHIPQEVRDWWTMGFSTPTPFPSLLEQARKAFPDRECGRDATRIMYGIATDDEPPRRSVVSVDQTRADLVSAARLIGLVGCLLDPWVDRISAEIAQSGRSLDNMTVGELRHSITRVLSSLQVAA